jgi:phosphoglucosamine mutase
MPRYAQALENVRVAERVVATEVLEEVDRLNAELGTDGRILVRPSGTEPVIRVLAEAPGKDEAANLCARVARLVRQHGGVAP